MQPTAFITQNFDIESSSFKNGLKLYSAVNGPLRQKILNLIHKRERITVTELFMDLGIEQPVASNHLAILRNAGLVVGKRIGKNVYYSINYSRLEFLHLKSVDLLNLEK